MFNLYLISTPIGNLEDVTIRALKTLFSVPVIACEDTRRTGQLLGLFKEKYKNILSLFAIGSVSKQRLISCYDQIEEQKTYEILDILEKKSDVAFVSDAGTPLISDPGYKLVKAAIKKGIRIIPVPGASSILSALVCSGFAPDNFTFLGYPPENTNRRRELFKNILLKNSSKIKPLGKTVILFISPHKLIRFLSELYDINPDTELVISRELTKIYEEIFRGTVKSALDHFKTPKGEFVILLSGLN